MAFDEIKTGDLYEWDDPSEEIDIEGILQDYEVTNTSKGEADRYEVQTKDGVIPFFAPTILHDKLQRINMGDVVKIAYTELDKTNAGNDLKKYKVMAAEPTADNLEEVGLEPEDLEDDDDGFDDVSSDDVPDL
jgi:translation initiation factor IF-1